MKIKKINLPGNHHQEKRKSQDDRIGEQQSHLQCERSPTYEEF